MPYPVNEFKTVRDEIAKKNEPEREQIGGNSKQKSQPEAFAATSPKSNATPEPMRNEVHAAYLWWLTFEFTGPARLHCAASGRVIGRAS